MKVYKIMIIIVAILLAGAAAYIFAVITPAEDSVSAPTLYIPDEPSTAVKAVAARKGMLVSEIHSSGILRGLNEAVIISETRGLIRERFHQIGDLVEEGDAILRVDAGSAESAVSQALRQYESAGIDYNSVERAFNSGGASEAELLQAGARLAGAEASYKDAKKRFDNSTIKSPISGVLADFNNSLTVGNYLTEGSNVATVIDIKGVRVDVFLSGEEVSSVEEGAPAIIESGGRMIDGRITATALSSDRATGSFRVLVEADNPWGSELRSGLSAEVTIKQVKGEPQVIIPASAIFRIGTGTYVFVSDDSKASLRPVTIGRISGSRAEVIKGLDEGETVVTTGMKSLTDGTPLLVELQSDWEE